MKYILITVLLFIKSLNGYGQDNEIVIYNTDGSILAIGATSNDGNGIKDALVRIFSWNGYSWSQLGSEIDLGSSSDISMSLNADGSILAIGLSSQDNNKGVVNVFGWDGFSWTQLGTVILGDATGDRFGTSVSLSANGSILAVGAPFNDVNGTEAGHVQVFEWDSNSSDWTQLGSIINGGAAEDRFGTSVSLSADASRLVVGGKNYVRLYSLVEQSNITQLELPGTSGENGWHLFTSPWNNPLNDFLEPLWTQGMTGSDAPDHGASNVYTYSESTQQYTAVPSLETSVIPGTGYALYAYADDDKDGASDSWPKTLIGSGSNLTSAVSIAVSNTDLDGSTQLSGEEGWNLMGNPYPYSIVVDSVISALQEVDPNASISVYIWNKAANEGEGAYLNSQENRIQNIAPFQAFWVRFLSSEASGNAVIRPTARTASFEKFYKTISGSIPAPMLSFTMSHEEFSSKARLRFNEQAQVGIDPYDVFSKAPLSERYVRMYSEVGDQHLSSNYLPLTGQQMEIPFALSSSELGTYELEWRVQEIPSDWTLNLIDSQGVSHALSTDGGIVFEFTETGEFPVFEVEWIPGTSNEVNPELPQRLELSQNYPNPFNPTTIIQFSLPQAGQAKVMVYNVMGQQVLELGGKRYEAGVHRLRMDARSLASGVYIYQLFVDEAWVQTHKMTLIK